MEGSTSIADPVVHLGVINISVIGYEWSYPIESLIYLPHHFVVCLSIRPVRDLRTEAFPLHGYPILQLAQFSMSRRTDITLIKKWSHRIAQLVTTSIATEHRNPGRWAPVLDKSRLPVVSSFSKQSMKLVRLRYSLFDEIAQKKAEEMRKKSIQQSSASFWFHSSFP